MVSLYDSISLLPFYNILQTYHSDIFSNKLLRMRAKHASYHQVHSFQSIWSFCTQTEKIRNDAKGVKHSLQLRSSFITQVSSQSDARVLHSDRRELSGKRRGEVWKHAAKGHMTSLVKRTRSSDAHQLEKPLSNDTRTLSKMRLASGERCSTALEKSQSPKEGRPYRISMLFT